MARAPDASVLSLLYVSRTLSRRAAFSSDEEICIFSWDKTELTMGKPEVNSSTNMTTFFPVALMESRNKISTAILTISGIRVDVSN